jgi:hypothetical protein
MTCPKAIESSDKVTALAQRKNPGSFPPGLLLERRQTIGIRSYAEHER